MKRQRNIGIGDRVIAGFGLVLVLFAVSIGGTRYYFGESARVQRQLSDVILPQRELAHEVEQNFMDIALGVRNYVLVPGATTREAYRATTREMQQRMARILGDSAAPDRRTILRRLDLAASDYVQFTDSILAGRIGYGTGTETEMRSRRERAIALARQYADLQVVDANSAWSALRNTRQQIQRGLLLAFVLGVSGAILVALATVRSIRRPTGELVRIARALEHGDWRPAQEWAEFEKRHYTDVRDSRNELLQIAHAFGAAGIALEARERQLRSTTSVCAATASSLDVRVITDAVLRDICEYTGADVGVAYVRESTEGKEFEPVATRALSTTLDPVRAGFGIPGEAVASKQSIVINDIPPDTPFRLSLGVDSLPPRSVAAIPCLFSGEVLGVIVVASLHTLDSSDIKFLESSASQLAVGLHNVQAFATAQRLLAEVETQREQIHQQLERLQAQHEELQAQHEEIQAQNEEIQAQTEEIQAQNAELQQQALALREADEHKDSFLGLLAHELRNPMSAISNSLFVLSNSGENPTVAARARGIIERQTRQLTRLVDDLLDVTRIARGKVHIQRSVVDFTAIVRDCVADHGAMAAAANISIDLVMPESPLTVYGDRERLTQVVGNLLDNSIKFSHHGSQVYVFVSADSDRQEIALSVRDEGIGIDAVMQARLFQPFTQADPSRTRARGGLGLGLSLVKAYVTLHHGSVSVESDGPGTGSTFTVRLPLVPDSDVDIDEIQQGADTQMTTSPRRVLLVEDDRDGAESLAQALRLDGHEVITAGTVQAAFDLACTASPDLVICDIGLPGLDGYEFARRVRAANEQLRSTYLVALSGYASENDKRRSREVGFDQHLTKPASIRVLRECLQQVPETTT